MTAASAPRLWGEFVVLLGRMAAALVVQRLGWRGRRWAVAQLARWDEFGVRIGSRS